jgi:hypothetical protein
VFAKFISESGPEIFCTEMQKTQRSKLWHLKVITGLHSLGVWELDRNEEGAKISKRSG